MAMSVKERNDLLLSNLGLIKTIASKYSHSSNLDDWEDSYQDGVEKFLEIIENFNPDKAKLSTFIWPYIQNHITENKSIIPVSVKNNMRRINDAREFLESEKGQKVGDSELSDYLGLTERKINRYRAKENSYKTVSLTPVSHSEDNNELNLLNLELNNPAGTPEENFFKIEEINLFKKAWNKLADEEKEILSYRTTYGTDLQKPLSLRKVAEIMGSNRVTISQKEKKAEAHLKKILLQYGICA